MPCDAIATARAQVPTTQVLKALTPEQVGEVIRQYLTAQEGFEVQQVDIAGQVITVFISQPAFTLQFYMKTGQVVVRSLYGLAFNRDKLANDVAAWVGQVAGVAFQEKVAAILGQIGAVTEKSRTPGHHSALVVKMRI